MGLIWAPQPGPQAALIDCPLPDIFFGGARGGGKSDGLLGKYALKQDRYGRGFNGVVFRHEMPQADDLIDRAEEIYGPLGGQYNKVKFQWSFPKGGRLRFRPLESVRDAAKYQGQNLSDAAVEEAGNFPDPAPIDRLWGALRSKVGVPVQMILTGNPGGAGQLWINQRYIDPAPQGMKVLHTTLPNGAAHRRIFIPSKVQNNRILLASDPNYINRLYLVGSPNLVRAWLDGDWSVIEGAFFDCWDPRRHVIEPIPIPQDWLRLRSGDWGSAKPFSFGWWAVVPDPVQARGSTGETVTLPRGCLVRIGEWYGCQDGKPNTGLKLHAEKVGEGLWDREKVYGPCTLAVLDPSAFSEDGGPSIHERVVLGAKADRIEDGRTIRGGDVWFQRADNTRVAGRGAMGGWDQMRARMVGDGDGNPMLACFSTCRDSIRTIPALQHDQSRAEDLDTNGEDHAADEWRYACMARPYVPEPRVPSRNPADRWGQDRKGGDNWKTV